MYSETIKLPRAVSAAVITEAVSRACESDSFRMWMKHVRKSRGKFQLGRAGRSTAFHTIVVPSEGNRWFDTHGRLYSSVLVTSHEWPGRTGMKFALQERLHVYYTELFAQKLAKHLADIIGAMPYVERIVQFCSECQQLVQFNIDYARMACPSHGTFADFTPVYVQVPI